MSSYSIENILIMGHHYVYIHTNKTDGKRYVGITSRERPEIRWNKGKSYKANTHFWSAIQKYGWDNFTHDCWELGSRADIVYAEKYLIAFYDTMNQDKGYNMTKGGDGTLGHHHSQATRTKMSKSHTGVPCSPMSEEQKELLRQINTGKRYSAETNAKKGAWAKGKKQSPEHIRKRSDSLKGRTSPAKGKKWYKDTITGKRIYYEP